MITCSDKNWYGYTEGIGANAKYNYPTGLALDATNNLLYVTDTLNNRIRTVDLKAYKTPSLTTVTQTQLDGTALGTGGTTTSASVLLNFTIQANDAISDTIVDIEVKPLSIPFDNTNFISVPTRVYSGSNITKTVTIARPTITLGTSYHWQYRVRDKSGNTGSWISF